MKLNYKNLLIIILLIAPRYTLTYTTVKVLLGEINSDQTETWLFSSDQTFKTIDLDLNQKQLLRNLKFRCCRNLMYLNGKLSKSSNFKIVPNRKPLVINGKAYAGTLLIKKTADRILLINLVELEDYVCSVLKTESWPGWPKEVNKAFAIACRTYALAQIASARKLNSAYHIKNNNYHQTYQGLHNDPVLKAAVKETTGVILGYQGEPILAMFDSCCGGVIPAHIEDFDFQSHPYLARTKPCQYCSLVKLYSWKITYSDKEFKTILQSVIPNLRTIKRIRTETDRAGKVKNLIIHGSREVYTINARTMYSLFKEIKSFCYSIYHQVGNVTVSGSGFGHHLGLCQWGAREMINHGYDYRKILKFYYPGATFMKFKG